MNIALNKQSWFATWFDTNYYQQLYQHRDNKEAEKFIDALLDELQPRKDSVMLDLGCGTGRHSKYLASKDFTVFGIDLSASSIREARKSSHESLYFLKSDMRKPFGKNNFDCVFSFFTSFGYFDSCEENNQVIRNMRTALKNNGMIVIDYLNVSYAEDHLVSVEEKEIDGVWYHINRWSDDRYIYKRIAIQDQKRLSVNAYTEKVAKFSLKDFNDFFEQNGLKTTAVFGDYELNQYEPLHSKRMILLAKKS